MLTRYCDNPAARFGKLLRRWLPDLEQKLAAVDEDQLLHNVLRTCADDLVMREVQDAFFDQTYWRPAFNSARTLGIRLPLGVAIVYDSTVHGSWQRMRDRTNDSVGQLQDIGELPWLVAYLKVRRNWLATHSRSDLRATVYRMDALQRLLDLGHTGLALPLVVRGIEISTASLAAASPSYFDGPAAGSRTLSVQSPLLRGHDVRRVQLGLSMDGMEIVADGVYGPTSAMRIRQYQLGRGYAATGVATPELIAELVG
jgi:chitosanase